jgi:hypothetical protein
MDELFSVGEPWGVEGMVDALNELIGLSDLIVVWLHVVEIVVTDEEEVELEEETEEEDEDEDEDEDGEGEIIVVTSTGWSTLANFGLLF